MPRSVSGRVVCVVMLSAWRSRSWRRSRIQPSWPQSNLWNGKPVFLILVISTAEKDVKALLFVELSILLGVP